MNYALKGRCFARLSWVEEFTPARLFIVWLLELV